MEKINLDDLTKNKKNELLELFKTFNKKGDIYSYLGITGNANDIAYVNQLCVLIGFDCDYYREKKKRFCLNCGKELKKGQYKFCSCSCAAKYNNHARGTHSEETKKKISDSLLKHNSKKEKVTQYCLCCGKELEKWQHKFCSLKCVAKYKSEHTPKRYCLECGKELVRGQYKFCSLECNHKYKTKDKLKRYCLECGKELNYTQEKFCSNSCSSKYFKKERLKKYLNGDFYINPNGAIPGFLREYLLERAEYKCEVCGYSGFNKKTHNTILQIHHVDGNSANNSIENLQVLCPNCHAETENFMGLNKGKSGRTERYKKNHNK